MSQQTVSADGVHIAGNFQGWTPGSTPMTLVGNGIYQYTATLNQGDSIQYKFINGNTWNNDESVPAACAFNGNRLLVVPMANDTLMAVCFASCDTCVVAPLTSEVTFRVNMKGQTVSNEGVFVAGPFNNWDYTQNALSFIGNDVYQGTVSFNSQQSILYRFANGASAAGQEVIVGNCTFLGNRQLLVPSQDTILPEVCFGLCDTSCINFSVEERIIESIHAYFKNENLIITGMPSGGYPAHIRLTDVLGKVVFDSHDYSTPHWEKTLYIAPAPYYLKIKLDGRERTIKLVKSH